MTRKWTYAVLMVMLGIGIASAQQPMPKTTPTPMPGTQPMPTAQPAPVEHPALRGQPTASAVVPHQATPCQTGGCDHAALGYGCYPCDGCGSDCGGCGRDCEINWLIPWTCDDLKREPVERDPCARRSIFFCPGDDDCSSCDCGCASGAPCGCSNGTTPSCGSCGEEAEEDDGPSTPLMQSVQCFAPGFYDRLDKRGVNLYGWVQMGFTGNFDSPRNRTNFGTGYNWRSNAYQLNQVWLTAEKALEHGDEFELGYRVDAMIGTDAPFNVQLGLFDDVVGRGQINRVGFDLPQFYVEAHIPNFLGTNGMDIKVGKWFTLVNYEVIPATGNFFYSHSYNFFFGPFNNTGVLTTTHVTDTIDVYAGIFVGWEAFEDNNSAPSYTAAVSWTSCDERMSWVTAMQTGPEQNNNNDNFRTQISSYLTTNFGTYDEWSHVIGGSYAYDSNAVAAGQDAIWHAMSTYLFYEINPKLKLGARGEYFRDEQGFRTGFAGTFYETTFGVNYFPWQNLRLRPELRFDWATNGQRPFNDGSDNMQTTAAVDLIWEF